VNEIAEISKKIFRLFSTDQDSHAEQQNDGRYYKKHGRITSVKIEQMLKDHGSIAVYQRNIDNSIKWICYDFDIIKSQLSESKRQNAQVELDLAVTKFCNFLIKKEISYFIEHSGNRGIHIWITFNKSISLKNGHEISSLLLEHAQLNYNSEIIAIDLFPHSNKVTNSVGSCVKLPLSKHKKSGCYSFFLKGVDSIENACPPQSLSQEFLLAQKIIVDTHIPVSVEQIEKTFNVFLSLHHTSYFEARIKEIRVDDFSLDELFKHWEKHPPLKNLKNKIEERNLNNQERKLLVGILGNVVGKDLKKIGEKILLKIFEMQQNYNKEITIKAIDMLSSFYFPTKEQIEDILKERFDKTVTDVSLLDAILIKVISFDQGHFDFCITDVEVTRNAEMKYLIQNDEAQSRKVFNELCIIRPDEYLSNIRSFIENYSRDKVNFYKHFRKESDKERELISLECLERMTTSLVLKQIQHFFNLPNSNSSHGYKVQNGFKNGFIFEPWLYLWIQFLYNISTFINNPDYSDCYIIKADIASFYNKVDHDKLKRMLLDSSPLSIIKEKLALLDSQSLEKYKKLITICLDISKATVTDDKGLPQGPAFARFFAELYLYEIDSKFEGLLSNDSILLYQRYVDDIFIVCKSENEAKEMLSFLESELSVLGLEIKHSKTLIKKVADFSPDYDKYRSQSKYSVDRISTNFSTATNEEKSHAINEFISLIQSDTKQDDYSFIFSHLRGVAEVEPLKNDEIDDILTSGIGRGSLYRNLFNHILEDEKNWHYITAAKNYNSLQSEVLTSTVINFIEEGKNSHDKFLDLMNDVYHKLTLTKMVNEHLLQMNLLIGLDVDYQKMSANSIVDVVSAFPLRLNIKTTAPLLEQINTELNSMNDKNKIINVLYALSRTAHIEAHELKKISSLFFSYVALNMVSKEFTQKQEFINESLSYTIKYHYLISLFSLSKVNTSRDLLVSMWKYCACMYNNIKHNVNEKIDYGWIHKIASLELDQNKLYVLLSSIVDGEIFRGTLDKRSVFKTYHTLLLIRLSEKISEWKSDEIDALLEKISKTSNFYEWIINREQTDLLPNSREWFDSNIIYNNTIMLKRGNSVLIRKPYELFYNKKNVEIAEDGYGEIIESYNTSELNTVLGVISKLNFKQFIEFLTNELDHRNEYGLPNIFTNTLLVRENTLKPFTNEIYSPRYFIFEENNELVSIKENSIKVFIELMFKKFSEATDTSSIEIYEKYIAKIPDEIDLVIFLKNLSRQLKAFNEMDDVSSIILIDLSIASALYSSIAEKNSPLSSFEKFTEFYLPNEEFSHSTYVYSVDDTMSIDDSNPKSMINTILNTITKTKDSAFPFLMLDIENGLIDYQNSIQHILSKDEGEFLVSIESFIRCQVKLITYTRTLELGNNESFDYSHVKYINYTGYCIEEISLSHSHYINKASHIYHSKIGDFIYLIALPPSFSKTFKYINYLSKTLTPQRPRTFTPYEINKVNISNIDRFEHAVHVIKHHKDIQHHVAKDILIKWLSTFPEKYREIFVLLIASHQYITSTEIDLFCGRILELIENNENAMLIKKVEDYNGTIRCFHKSAKLSRKVSSLDPALIDIERSQELSIIVDVIISGTQICHAMNFYITGSGNNNCYFDGIDKYGIPLNTKLEKVTKLKIHCILYTQDSIVKIEESLKKIMPSLKEVEVLGVRNIGDDAYFGSTTAIGNNDKEKIYEMLCDEEECLLIYSYLKHPAIKNKEFRTRYVLTTEKIAKTNLVARFQSLPKMCFSFLYFGLKSNSDLHPMDRILESNDMK
jgi:hypothetical protein